MSDQKPCPECGHPVFPATPGSKLLPEEVDAEWNYSPHTKARCETWKSLAMARDLVKGLKVLFACPESQWSDVWWSDACVHWRQRIKEFEEASRMESAPPCRDCGSPRKAGVPHTASECRDALLVLIRKSKINQERSAVAAGLVAEARGETIARTTQHHSRYTPGRSEIEVPASPASQTAARAEAYNAGLMKGFYLAVEYVDHVSLGWSNAKAKLEEALKKVPAT